MKYVVILGDGMADWKVEELGGKTPLQYSNTENFDYFAKHGEVGMVKTVPTGMNPGSDTANLAVFGYDPAIYYSGRSPYEAASIGVPMEATDVTFRCNFVTLSQEEEYGNRVMLDHSSDEITTAEATVLLAAVREAFATEEIEFHEGISYRHIMLWHEAPYEFKLIPPHDIIGKTVRDFMPKGPGSEKIHEMMEKSANLLKDHPVNLARIARGLKPANSIWIWGEGKKPLLTNFEEKYGLKGSVISAVDLIKGIGLCADMNIVEVEGATGNVHTNFKGKADAALKELENGADFVYVHVEAPDECGHRNELGNKVKSIELLDEKVAKVIKEGLDKRGEAYKILVLPDHPTPLAIRTHTGDPVPFVIYDSTKKVNVEEATYDEEYANSTGLYIEEGYKLMDLFIKGEI
jgi:2,3-bisphosphoglycerate-independent phosphoglycerate mutase